MSAQSFIQEGMAAGYIHSTDAVETLTISGHHDSFRVYEVRLDRLKYNVRNGRIVTDISRYAQEKGELPYDDVVAMNQICEKAIEDSNPQRLRVTKLDIRQKGQQRPAVILSDGTVIDGNRRFTCLRQLEREEGMPRYLRCLILDSSLDGKSLKTLELELQFGQDEKVGYDPVERLVDIYRSCLGENANLSVDEYRTACGMKKAEMDAFVAQAELMNEFLEFINAEAEYHIVRDLKLQGPLNELYLILKKCHDEDKREDIKSITFATFLTIGDTDITRRVRNMGKIELSQKDSLSDDFIEDELEACQKVLRYLEAVPEGKDVDVAYIRDVIRQDKRLKEQQDAIYDKYHSLLVVVDVMDYQAKQVQKARDDLDRVDVALFGKLSDEQLESIQSALAEVRKLADAIQAAADQAQGARS